jgi:predicted AlkP superfamily pyrophosphatase or phosphodiesterase
MFRQLNLSHRKHMSRLLALASLLVVFSTHGVAQPAAPRLTKHVVLISIDGLRPDFYLDARWPTPNLQAIKARGLHALRMRSVFPSHTYPSHTAMLTGALPARSGIIYNAPMGSKGDWYWFTKDIKAPTLWQALKSAGMTSAAVQWPVSAGPDITYNVPEIWDPARPEDRITEARKHATPGLVEELERNATGKLDGENMNETAFGLDDNAGRMASYILKTYKPSLLAVHFAHVDGVQHEHGRNSEELKAALGAIDRAVGNLLETIERSGLKDSTTVLIVGDHGFMDVHSVVRPNIWLRQKGIKARFQPSGGSAFLYLDTKNDVQTLERVKQMLRELPASHRKLFTVYDRAKLDELGADSSAALALAAMPGIVFGSAVEGDVMGSTRGGHHGYDPTMPDMSTGFLAQGVGINTGLAIPELGVTDIAPLIAKLLGLTFPTLDGVLLPGIVKK